MASNNNNPRKGSGANQPDKKQPIASDAASVDWMIMSDLTTRIGGYPEPKKEVHNSSTTTSPQSVNNQADNDDLEDLEWLRSLGLDEAIEPSSAKKNIVSASQNSDAIDDIDWLIVGDIRTKMDSPENIQPSSGYQNVNPSNKLFQVSEESNSLDSLLNEDLGLDGLGFDGDANFDGFNSFELGSSENAISNDLQNDLDITEGKIQELSQFFGDSFDTSNDSNNEWDNDFGNLVNTDSQFSSYSDLGIIEESFEIPTQITGIADDIKYTDESNGFGDYFTDSAALIADASPEFAYQEDLQEDLQNNLPVSETLPDELIEEFNFEGLDDGFQNVNEFQDLPAIVEISEVNDSWEEANNSLDLSAQELDEFKLSESSDLDAFRGDEVWNAEANFEAEANNQSSDLQASDVHDAFNINNTDGFNNIANNIKEYEIDDAFASDWEQNAQNPIIITDDAIWDSPASIVAESIASKSIDNAFGTLDDWAIAPQPEQPEAELKVEPKVELTESQAEANLEPSIDNADDFEWNQESAINNTESATFANELIESRTHEEFDFGGMEQSSEWDKFSDSFTEQITDSDFSDDISNYAVKSVDTINSANLEKDKATTAQDFNNPEDADGFDDLESIIDEDFDLGTFDDEGFPEIPLTDVDNNIPSTTLTPNRAIPVPTPLTKNATSDITPPPLNVNVNVSDSKNNLSLSNFPEEDPFEEALAYDLQSDELINDYDLEVNLHEEALANDLLNGDMSDSEVLANHIPEKDAFFSPPPPIPPQLSPQISAQISSKSPSPESFTMDTNDHDFLDDFDLDSLDTQLTGDDFGSAFATPAVSTGLTPPVPPIAPLPPSMNTQNLTAPSVNSPPPPPPFLPPLPPKRNPAQAKPPSGSPSAQNKPARKPISSLDEGWSELLDADTVLSGVLRSPSSEAPSVEPRGAMPPHTAGKTADRTATSTGNNLRSNTARPSQGRERDYNSFTPPKKKDTGLPDFNDLSLEIHDDNTDWSGLLDSSDLSDSITSISEGATPSSRTRTPPLAARSELTGISETREIPRDRRKPVSGFDATQARMAATSDPIDFNRFTEDNYGYEPPEVAAPPKKLPKMSMPSVSLESLWQNYLKIPVIGLGAIGGAFLLYSFLNRPVFDIGLRWGIFKDASGKDFSNADFKGAKLDNVDFSKAILTGAKMQDASLVGANFTEANLDGVNFTNANLNRARLIQASVVWAEFNKAQMNLVDLERADLTLSNFANAKMEGANLLKSKIGAQGTDKATKFSATMLLAWQIVNDPREGRNLAEQDLSGLNLSFTSLKRANLSNAKLNYTDLTGTDLRGANLTGSQVNGANWSGAKLAGVNLTDVNFDASKLPKTDEETICPNSKKGPCKF